MTTTMTKERSTADRATAQALAQRGGPYSPREYAALESLDPLERAALRFRTVGASIDADEAEIRRKVAERFGAKRADAERDLAGAIEERETAVEEMFTRRDALAAVQSTTWILGGQGHAYQRGGTPAQIEEAKAALEDAERALRAAQSREQDARVKVTTIGAAVNAYARELGGEHAK